MMNVIQEFGTAVMVCLSVMISIYLFEVAQEQYMLKVVIEDESVREYYATYKAAHIGDSGIDLFIPANTSGPLIDYGIRAALYDGFGRPLSFFLMPRSSIADHGVSLVTDLAVIDAGYRGTLSSHIVNPGDVILKRGMRIVQLCAANLVYGITVQVVDELEPFGDRDDRGFGSTGV